MIMANSPSHDPSDAAQPDEKVPDPKSTELEDLPPSKENDEALKGGGFQLGQPNALPSIGAVALTRRNC
jgi:hypothetical protein